MFPQMSFLTHQNKSWLIRYFYCCRYKNNVLLTRKVEQTSIRFICFYRRVYGLTVGRHTDECDYNKR